MTLPAAPMSSLFRAACAILSVLVVLSALAGIGLAFYQRPIPAWFLLLFEAPILVSGVFGLLLAKGSSAGGARGPAITLLCIAGCVGAGSVLGYVGSGREVAGFSMLAPLRFRVMLGAAFGALAAVNVLSRNPRRSIPLLLRSGLFMLPVVVVAALLYKGVGRAAYASLPDIVQVIVVLFGGAVLGGLICASVHFAIRAFQVCYEDETPAPAAAF